MERAHNDQILEELTWQQARDSIHKVNPELAEIIDAWNPDKNYKLIRIRYRYGERILQDGVFQIPIKDGSLVPFNNLRIPSHITEQLSYSNLPLGVITHNGCEVFLEENERVIPLAFFKPGIILGLWEALEPKPSHFPRRIWDVYAGARSLFMLPKISQVGLHENLKKKYGVKSPAPKNSFAHAPIFSEIAHSKHFKSDWYHEVIFFGKEWLKEKPDDIGWLRFQYYLLTQFMKLSNYNRNLRSYEKIWQLFADYLEEKNIKPNTFLIDTLKHLIAIGLGIIPGYKPAINTETPGPIKELQEVYLQDYGLKTHIPTIMMPADYDATNINEYIYYSLQTPSLFANFPKNRTQTSVMSEVRELKILVNEFYNAALSDKLKIENTPFEWLVKNIKFDFFHSDDDPYREVQPTSKLPIEDKNFIYLPGKMRGRKFSETASFVRGCVRLSRIKI